MFDYNDKDINKDAKAMNPLYFLKNSLVKFVLPFHINVQKKILENLTITI